MDTELSQLESQIEQLISLHARLKADNVDLRGRVSRLEAENRQLGDKLRLAAEKLEAVLEKLPEA
jgi:cell division protein ZapB